MPFFIPVNCFDFQNDVSETEQRWGAKTVEGSGRVGALRYYLAWILNSIVCLKTGRREIRRKLVRLTGKRRLNRTENMPLFGTILSFCSMLTRDFSCAMSEKFVQCWRGICSNRLLSKN